MSIKYPTDIQPLSQDGFHAVDRYVMRHAFEIHNTIGRLLDESIYRYELARRCSQQGYPVKQEALVKAIICDFRKAYYLDLLIANGAIYELKKVSQLTSQHEYQLLNYLFLTGIHHGKLINFGTRSVEYRFVSTGYNHNKRRNFTLNSSQWHDLTEHCQNLTHWLRQILDDWGTCLDINLYRDALLHLLGGYDNLHRTIPVWGNGTILGHQNILTLGHDVSLHLSAISRHSNDYKKHLSRLIRNTEIKAIQWVNFNQRQITLQTIKE